MRNKKYIFNNEYTIDTNGTIVRLKDNQEMKPQFRKNGKYASVVLNGKSYYVHRLLALEFIPNPNNYQFVGFKDDDTKNISLDNLYWKEERKEVNRFHPCAICGKKTYLKNKYCYACKSKAITRDRRLEEQKDLFQDVDMNTLTPIEKTVLELRKAGHSYSEIAKVVNKTRSRVGQIINKYI